MVVIWLPTAKTSRSSCGICANSLDPMLRKARTKSFATTTGIIAGRMCLGDVKHSFSFIFLFWLQPSTIVLVFLKIISNYQISFENLGTEFFLSYSIFCWGNLKWFWFFFFRFYRILRNYFAILQDFLKYFCGTIYILKILKASVGIFGISTGFSEIINPGVVRLFLRIYRGGICGVTFSDI